MVSNGYSAPLFTLHKDVLSFITLAEIVCVSRPVIDVKFMKGFKFDTLCLVLSPFPSH